MRGSRQGRVVANRGFFLDDELGGTFSIEEEPKDGW
jgi:hypothetical protein